MTEKRIDPKEAVRRVIEEAFNQGSFGVLSEVFDPGFIENQFGLHATIEGMKGDIQSLRKSFPDLKLTIEDILQNGEDVWVRSTARGTNLGGIMGPPNGKSFQIAVFDVLRFKDGKIVEHWGSPDRFHLMAQLGLLPR